MAWWPEFLQEEGNTKRIRVLLNIAAVLSALCMVLESQADIQNPLWESPTERNRGRVETRCYGITEEFAAELKVAAWSGL